jgi:hypothetical protein
MPNECLHKEQANPGRGFRGIEGNTRFVVADPEVRSVPQ